VGSWNRDYWVDHGASKDRIFTALFCVDNRYFERQAEMLAENARDLRASWGATEEDVVFLFCAKLTAVKAPELLLRAFASLGEGKSVLVFVGSGPLEEELRTMAYDLGVRRIHFGGFVNQSRLAAYYKAADVLVLPSRHEPWGLVVNEAMACGLPCIVSDVVGAGADLIAGKDTGMVFARDAVASLKNAMAVACRPAIRESWRRNIPMIIEKITYSQNVDALRKLLLMIGQANREGTK